MGLLFSCSVLSSAYLGVNFLSEVRGNGLEVEKLNTEIDQGESCQRHKLKMSRFSAGWGGGGPSRTGDSGRQSLGDF